MANFVYDKALESFARAEIFWTVDDIKVVCVDAALYTAVQATDQYLSDIPAGARVATSGNLAGKTDTSGVLDADDVTISAVTGDEFEAVVVYKDTGLAATSSLIAYIDTATGLALTPNGGDVSIAWSNGANRICKL